MKQITERGNTTMELLSEYAEFIDLSAINYLLELMGKEEKKTKDEILKELGISRSALYQPNTSTEAKQLIIKEAFKCLDPSLVITILYGRIKTIFINFIVDILSVTANEIKTNSTLAELGREILTENTELLKDIRDIERRKIIEIITNLLKYNS